MAQTGYSPRVGDGMTVSTLTLADFLLARIAQDEERARLAAHLGQEWQPGGPGVWAEATTVLASDGALPRSGRSIAEVDDVAAPHVLAWSPARALAECEAKRRIVSMRQFAVLPDTAADGVLRALALPYADHPDYRTEWRL